MNLKHDYGFIITSFMGQLWIILGLNLTHGEFQDPKTQQLERNNI